VRSRFHPRLTRPSPRLNRFVTLLSQAPRRIATRETPRARQMTAHTRAGVSALLARMDVLELSCCCFANRSSDLRLVRSSFRVVSRLGDGVFWYCLMALLPLLYGQTGARVALQMALTALAGLALYRYLKLRLVRERPHVLHAGIRAGAPALDRYRASHRSLFERSVRAHDATLAG